jgi:hypothetical protein
MLNPTQISTFAPRQDDIGAVKVYIRFTPKADIDLGQRKLAGRLEAEIARPAQLIISESSGTDD